MKYTAVTIDQPEIFIHADSPYKGIKPDGLAATAGLASDAQRR